MGFLSSLSLPLEAVRLIRKTPALRRLALISAGVTAACYLAVAVLLYFAAPWLLSVLWPKPAGWLLLLWYPAVAILFALGFFLGAQAAPVIVLAPLLDRLSVATEDALGRAPTPGGLGRFFAETWRGVVKAALRVALLFGGQTVLLILWLLPGVGQPLFSLASAVWSMLWLAFEYVDVTANRHGLGFAEVRQLLRQNLRATIGLGAALYLLLWLPFLNLFLVPIAVVAATRYYRQLVVDQTVGDP
jgi:CysZ protein